MVGAHSSISLMCIRVCVQSMPQIVHWMCLLLSCIGLITNFRSRSLEQMYLTVKSIMRSELDHKVSCRCSEFIMCNNVHLLQCALKSNSRLFFFFFRRHDPLLQGGLTECMWLTRSIAQLYWLLGKGSGYTAA